jgi:hypothetical protein
MNSQFLKLILNRKKPDYLIREINKKKLKVGNIVEEMGKSYR